MKRLSLSILLLLAVTPAPVCGPHGCTPSGFWQNGPARRFTVNLFRMAAPQPQQPQR